MNDGYGSVQKFGIKQHVWLCQQENDDKPRDFNRTHEISDGNQVTLIHSVLFLSSQI